MGQYLAIGLVVKKEIKKKELEISNSTPISVDEIISKMEKEYYFDKNIYNQIETETTFLFELKNEILFNQLVPFLEKLYPLLLPNEKSIHSSPHEIDRYSDKALLKLKSSPPSEYLNIAKDKSFYSFQYDEYAHSDYINFYEKSFSPYIQIKDECISFSLEGKILMENHGSQFNFLKYCVAKAFPDFSIANAIRVYITG
jgi:hypothetical protein